MQRHLLLIHYKILLHIFTDGRDCGIKSAKTSLYKLNRYLKKNIKIASISGRYYAMDRNKNWGRTKLVYDMLTNGKSKYKYNNVYQALISSYQRNETDEFIYPSWCGNKMDKIKNNDIIIFMNFRADRILQISKSFGEKNFVSFKKSKIIQLKMFVTLTEYTKLIKAKVIFKKKYINNTLGEILSKNSINQLRISETEKYAHITYFFNAGLEKSFMQEKRILVKSDNIKSYDLQPQMKSTQITDHVINNMPFFDVIVCNYANSDMVGHTGNYYSTIKAIEYLDKCLSKIYDYSKKLKFDILITSDHGNAEHMFDVEKKKINTSHTSNLIPFVYIGEEKIKIRQNGELKDIAPTITHLLGIKKIKNIKGKSLIKSYD